MTHPCLRDAGDRARSVLKVRGERLVLAKLLGDQDAARSVVDELDGCPFCMGVTIHFLADVTATLHEDSVGHDQAVENVQRMIAEDLDE